MLNASHLWLMTRAQYRQAAIRAIKMSRLQPARRPSLPTKILRRVDGCALGWVQQVQSLRRNPLGLLVRRSVAEVYSKFVSGGEKTVQSTGAGVCAVQDSFVARRVIRSLPQSGQKL